MFCAIRYAFSRQTVHPIPLGIGDEKSNQEKSSLKIKKKKKRKLVAWRRYDRAMSTLTERSFRTSPQHEAGQAYEPFNGSYAFLICLVSFFVKYGKIK